MTMTLRLALAGCVSSLMKYFELQISDINDFGITEQDLIPMVPENSRWLRFGELADNEDPFLIEMNQILAESESLTREIVSINKYVLDLYTSGMVEVNIGASNSDKPPEVRFTADGRNIMFAQTIGTLVPIAEA